MNIDLGRATEYENTLHLMYFITFVFSAVSLFVFSEAYKITAQAVAALECLGALVHCTTYCYATDLVSI